MPQHNTMVSQPKWYDSAHASLGVLGKYLRQIGFFEPLEKRVHLEQKVLKYTPTQKLEMLFVGLLAGIKAVSHTATTVRVDVALTAVIAAAGLCRSIGAGRYLGCRSGYGCGGSASCHRRALWTALSSPATSLRPGTAGPRCGFVSLTGK